MSSLIFVAGDVSQVGKTTVCVGVLTSLLRVGFRPCELAYIKPATQCEGEQLVARFCASQGIACVPIGPIVYYPGFTRAYLAGETDTSAELLVKAVEAVSQLSVGRKVVVVDGVGYPAVGSVCGVSNADIAAALKSPVMLVGKKGVGDAIDSFNLNRTFFVSHGVRVVGAVFNRLPNDSSYYSLEKCKHAVLPYFAKYRPDVSVYGFLSEVSGLNNTSPPPPPPSSAATAPVDISSAGAGPGAGAGAGAGAGTGAVSVASLTPADIAALDRIAAEFQARFDVHALLNDVGVSLPSLASNMTSSPADSHPPATAAPPSPELPAPPLSPSTALSAAASDVPPATAHELALPTVAAATGTPSGVPASTATAPAKTAKRS